MFGFFPPYHGIPFPLLLIGSIIMGIYIIGAGFGGILLIGNEDHDIGDAGNDAGNDAGEAAALEDLHMHPSLSFWNGTTKGTRGGVWAGTGWDEGKNKRKLIPVLPRTRAEIPFQKNGTHGAATGTLCRVSGVGSCHPTDEPATAKHPSLCSSGNRLFATNMEKTSVQKKYPKTNDFKKPQKEVGWGRFRTGPYHVHGWRKGKGKAGQGSTRGKGSGQSPKPMNKTKKHYRLWPDARSQIARKGGESREGREGQRARRPESQRAREARRPESQESKRMRALPPPPPFQIYPPTKIPRNLLSL